MKRFFITPIKLFLSLLCIIAFATPILAAPPQVIKIPCPGQPIIVPTGQYNLLRAQGDGTPWSFNMVPAKPDVHIAVSSWKFNGKAQTDQTLIDEHWGTFTGGGTTTSLSWNSPQTTGTFTVEVKFKRWCGGTSIPGGLGETEAKEETLFWAGDVTSIELGWVSFGGGKHILKQDDGTYTAGSDTSVRTPEIKKTTGTGFGSNPLTPAIYELPSPICYTWETSPTINASFNTSQAEGNAELKIKVSATVGNTILSYSESTITLNGNTTLANFTTTDKLPKAIKDIDIALDWQTSSDNGVTWKPLISTTNRLFITAGTPIGSAITVIRMAKATSDASGASTEAAIGDAIGPIATGLANSLRALGRGLSSEWGALDPDENGIASAECAVTAQLMKSELEILGVTGAEVRYVYARHTSWNMLATTSNSGIELGPTTGFPPAYRKLILCFPGPNSFEACCFFNGKYWMGNFGESRPKAIDILTVAVDYPNVNNGADQKRQAWMVYDTGTQAEHIEANGVTFPLGAPPTY